MRYFVTSPHCRSEPIKELFSPSWTLSRQTCLSSIACSTKSPSLVEAKWERPPGDETIYITLATLSRSPCIHHHRLTLIYICFTYVTPKPCSCTTTVWLICRQ
ncbi:hypothetical protein BDV97DRAFT_3517 [Delphinella strobiligena]|nr:hypothetical protein BDV97DRAFT_3517 [Delphinella strobiligena]